MEKLQRKIDETIVHNKEIFYENNFKKSSSISIIIFNLLLNILHDKKLVQTLQRPRCDSSITKIFT